MKNEQEVRTLDLGQIGYEAYRAHAGGVSLAHGGALPQWSELEQKFVDAWNEASAAVEAAIRPKKATSTPELMASKQQAMLAESSMRYIGDLAPEPSIGRIVIWHGENKCPAIVTRLIAGGNLDGGLVLSVFTGVIGDPVRTIYGCFKGEGRGQWSWPERA